MKLLTKEIERKLPSLYSQDGKPADQVKVAVKFFCPWNSWTWYATEGEYQEESGTWLFFGLVKGLETELGYFTLSELESARGPGGLRIERDLHFGNHTLADVQEKQFI